jgi:lysophospholipase L1-like esterase
VLKTLKLASIALLTTATGLLAAPTAAKPAGMPVAPATRPTAVAAGNAITAAAITPAVVNPIPFEKEVLALESAFKKNNAPTGGILFYGSSSIRLWKGMKEDFPGMNVLNHGFGGSTAPDALRYFDRLVVPAKPSTIVFYEGDNDLKKGRTPEQFLGDVQSFVQKVESKLPNTKIIILSVKPSPSRADLMSTQKKVNSMIEGWVKQTKDPRVTFVNTFSSMLDAGGKPRVELFGPDKLHMNREGYKIWTKLIGLVPSADSTSPVVTK